MRWRGAYLALLLAGCVDRPLPAAVDFADQTLSACVTAMSCGMIGAGIGYSLAACLDEAVELLGDRAAAANWRLTPVGLTCLAKAVGCDEAWRCVAADDPPKECGVYLNLTGHCDGDVLTYCGAPLEPRYSGGHWIEFDCASVGLHCLSDGMVASCGERPCTPGVPLTCDGDLRVRCEGQLGTPGFVQPERDCSLSGGHCTDGTSQGCVGGNMCDACAARGLRCDHTGTRCVLGIDCDPHEAPRCDGSVLNVCELGQRSSYDCRAHGFAGCSYESCAPTAP